MIILERCGCQVDHGIASRCERHALGENNGAEAKLAQYAKQAADNGPSKVMCSKRNWAHPEMAKDDFGVESDVVFIRSDGWTLGAPRELALDAYRTAEGEWLGTLDLRTGELVAFDGQIELDIA